MLKRHERCYRCNELCVEKDNQLLGPLQGKYEYLCKHCALVEETIYPPLEDGSRP